MAEATTPLLTATQSIEDQLPRGMAEATTPQLTAAHEAQLNAMGWNVGSVLGHGTSGVVLEGDLTRCVKSISSVSKHLKLDYLNISNLMI